MPQFLTTKAIAYYLEEIIKKAFSDIYIVTPYLKMSYYFYERLVEASKHGTNLNIIYGKTDLSDREQDLFGNLNCNLYYKENLHGKCYVNEQLALVTSMNFHSFSETHNREFGVLLSKEKNCHSYLECIDEINSIINSSEIIKQSFVPKGSIAKPNSMIEDDFNLLLYQYLKTNYKTNSFKIENDIIFANKFPCETAVFSTKYGFASFRIEGNWAHLESIKKRNFKNINSQLKGYRFFWDTANRLSLYPLKSINFESSKEKLSYCAKGIHILQEELNKILSSH